MKMKFKIACLAVFLTGVVLSGAGVSLTFVEWSSLSYGGKKTIEPENANIKTYSEAVDMSGMDILNVYNNQYAYRYTNVEIVESAEMPQDLAVVEISYNSDILEPYVKMDTYEDRDSGEGFTDGIYDELTDAEKEDVYEDAEKHQLMQGNVYISSRYYDEFAEIMLVKDDVLQSLREKKLHSYSLRAVYEVKIMVSPESRSKINIYNGY